MFGKIELKKLLLLSIAMLFLFSFLGYATTFSVAISTPVNNTEYYSTSPFVVNASLADGTQLYVANYSFDGGSWNPMTNNSVGSYTWNSTAFTITNSNTRALRNVTVRLNDTLGSGNLSTNTAWFYINERAANSILLTPSGPTNSSYYSYSTLTSISTNVTVSTCSYYYNGASASAMSDVSGHTVYQNSSATTFTNTPWGTWSNITFSCADAFGNTSWVNTTASVGYVLFKVDTHAPQVTFIDESPRYINSTTANYVNITTSVLDNTTSTCGFYLYDGDGTTVGKTGTLSTDAQTRYCNLTLITSDLSTLDEGNITVRGWSADLAGNTGYSSTNESLLLSTWTGAKWSLVTYSDSPNATLTAFAARYPYVSSIALFNNEYNMKNYTTFSTSAPTINPTVNLTTGTPFWVYTPTTTYYLRNNSYSSASGSQYANVNFYSSNVSSRTGWNLLGMYAERTMNQTLYWNTNITKVALYDDTTGYNTVCNKGYESICAGTSSGATAVTIKASDAVWVYINYAKTNNNALTINRTTQ